jgi:D-alanyl-D-alanine endopeptidase (penicillin-binding protein 7)
MKRVSLMSGARCSASIMTLLVCLYSTLAAPAVETKLADLTGTPDLRSASALVIDAHGNVIYGKDENAVRPIASITKLMTAIVTLDANLDLDENITIRKEDRDLIQLTGSRLEYGARLSREEMLLLALMSSENRAAAALGRSFPGGTADMVLAMNAKARQLGMTNSHFSDPVGLGTDNVSTARDLVRMLEAASDYPLIARASTTLRTEVRPYDKRGPLVFGNTNRLLRNANWSIELGKTGYINESGRCLVMQASIEGEDVSIVLLNSFGKLTPFGDSNRLRRWILGNIQAKSTGV